MLGGLAGAAQVDVVVVLGIVVGGVAATTAAVAGRSRSGRPQVGAAAKFGQVAAAALGAVSLPSSSGSSNH